MSHIRKRGMTRPQEDRHKVATAVPQVYRKGADLGTDGHRLPLRPAHWNPSRENETPKKLGRDGWRQVTAKWREVQKEVWKQGENDFRGFANTGPQPHETSLLIMPLTALMLLMPLAASRRCIAASWSPDAAACMTAWWSPDAAESTRAGSRQPFMCLVGDEEEQLPWSSDPESMSAIDQALQLESYAPQWQPGSSRHPSAAVVIKPDKQQAEQVPPQRLESLRQDELATLESLPEASDSVHFSELEQSLLRRSVCPRRVLTTPPCSPCFHCTWLATDARPLMPSRLQLESLDYLGDWADPRVARDSIVLCCDSPEVIESNKRLAQAISKTSLEPQPHHDDR